MRNNFLKLIEQTPGRQDHSPQKHEDLTTPRGEPEETKLRGNKDVSILSINEWSTLVGIYRSSDHSELGFDPLQIVSRERVRKSIINGIPPNLRGDIWCMLCRCQREKDMHGEGMYQKLQDTSISNPQNIIQIKKDITRTFTNYPSNLK
jgi:hypothetical protein